MGTCQNKPQKRSIQRFVTKRAACVTYEQVKKMTNDFETVHITVNLLIIHWHSRTNHSATRKPGEDCGPLHCLSTNKIYPLILFIK